MQFSEETKEKIAELCRRHSICELSLFGSRSRGDHRVDSDYDLLIEFNPAAKISLFDYGRAWVEFEELLGYEVDLVTKTGLKDGIKAPVLSEAQLIYAERR